jgi:hypothetical protein
METPKKTAKITNFNSSFVELMVSAQDQEEWEQTSVKLQIVYRELAENSILETNLMQLQGEQEEKKAI